MSAHRSTDRLRQASASPSHDPCGFEAEYLMTTGDRDPASRARTPVSADSGRLSCMPPKIFVDRLDHLVRIESPRDADRHVVGHVVGLVVVLDVVGDRGIFRLSLCSQRSLRAFRRGSLGEQGRRPSSPTLQLSPWRHVLLLINGFQLGVEPRITGVENRSAWFYPGDCRSGSRGCPRHPYGHVLRREGVGSVTAPMACIQFTIVFVRSGNFEAS